jgi:stage IV sporulation protein FB
MAALLLGTGVREIYFTPVSIRIATAQRKTLSYGGELFVAAGGILANLAAALFLRLFLFASMRNMLMTASHLAVAIFNFLPAGSLDGGQIVRIICLRAAGCEAAEKISRAAGLAVLLPLTAAAIYLAARGTVNFTAPVIFGYLALVMIIRER